MESSTDAAKLDPLGHFADNLSMRTASRTVLTRLLVLALLAGITSESVYCASLHRVQHGHVAHVCDHGDVDHHVGHEHQIACGHHSAPCPGGHGCSYCEGHSHDALRSARAATGLDLQARAGSATEQPAADRSMPAQRVAFAPPQRALTPLARSTILLI